VTRKEREDQAAYLEALRLKRKWEKSFGGGDGGTYLDNKEGEHASSVAL
jgi:hypothetical protein